MQKNKSAIQATEQRMGPASLARVLVRTVVAVVLCGGSAPSTVAQPAPVESDRILVRYRPDISVTDKVSTRASAWVDRDVAYRLVPGLERVVVRPGQTVAAALAAFHRDPHVLYAEPDRAVHVDATPNDPRYGELWGLSNAKAEQAWDVTTGSVEVAVAVIDSGMDRSHPDLQGEIWTNPGETASNGIDDDGNGYVDDVYGWDFAYGDNDPSDGLSHGTHVSGTIGARGNNAVGVVGVNWRVKLAALKVFNDLGYGWTSDVVLALQYAQEKGFRLVNYSGGGNEYDPALYDAIQAVQAADQLVVASAGNDATDNDTRPKYPASFDLDNIIAVASIASGDLLSGFSNYGLVSVDLGAPGSSILSTIPGAGYGYISGTSMAAPHVTGAAALLLANHPAWTYAQLKSAILDTARPIAALAGKTVTGGTLDLAAALTGAEVPPIALAGLTLRSSIVAGCKSVSGTAVISRPAPPEGVVVTLADTLAAASVPGTVTVTSGSTTRNFIVKTVPVGIQEAGTVSATLGSTTLTQSLVVRPIGMLSVALSPNSVVGGMPVAGTAKLECSAAPGPIEVSLASNNAAADPVAPSIYVPAGAQSATFDIVTNAVLAKTSAAVSGTANGIQKSRTLTVNVAAAVTPASLKFGSVPVGQTSAVQSATLTNKGAASFAVTGIAISGTNAAWFAQTNGCPSMLSPGATCTIAVTFKPLAVASRSAKLSIATSATNTPLSVSLSGSGI